MNDYNPREENTHTTVKFVGSSWVVCKSKKRSQHVYYFNTETGETVWNLSEAEIEKTKNNKKQLGTRLVKSPEPKEQPHSHVVKSLEPKELSPMDFSALCSQSARTSDDMHSVRLTKQINNQSSSQQMSNLAFPGFVTSNASYIGATNNFTTLNALNTFNPDAMNGLNPSLNLNNITSMYNPNIWAVPQQIYMAPMVSPLVNQAQASLNIGYNNIHQTIAGGNVSTLLSNYEDTNQQENSFQRKTLPQYRNNIRNLDQRRQFELSKHRLQRNENINDLRTKLSANRRFQFNKSSSFTSSAQHFGKRQKINPTLNIRPVFVPDPGSKQFIYEETSSRLDLTPLKSFAAANFLDTWFIVVDMDVILNEFKFLNILSDSDAQCHLVVPRHTMSELEHYVATSQDVQARRIQRFLSQQIEHGDVMIAEESNESEDDDTTNMLLSTCFKLSEDNYYLVLLTNDSELLSYKGSIPISVLTPNEAKRLLNISRSKSNLSNAKPSAFKPNCLIKNEVTESNNNVSIIKSTNKSPNVPTLPKIDKQCSSEAHISPEPVKNTMDVAIQTDLSNVNASTTVECSNITEDIQKQTCDIIKNMENKLNTDTATRASSDHNLIKKRTIQLKRTISNLQPLVPPKTDEKKTFKWRRRKNPRSQVKETVTENIDPITQVTETVIENIDPITQVKETVTENIDPITEVTETVIENIDPITQVKETVTENIDPITQVTETVIENIDPKKTDSNTKTEHHLEDKLSNSNVIIEKPNVSKSQDVVRASDTSIASSDVSIVNQNVTENDIIIEETSTSGISNTISNVDAQIVKTKKQSETQFDNVNIKESKAVIYGVDSPSMEEYLVMKCDEWVSRFIQIMEEALTVVLQHDPPFSTDSLPPPWTIYEAAQCIKMKFSSNNSIKDATFKLSDILLKVSDRRGKINVNIKPSEYMEMYSYGVYLLDTITAVVNNCEDLQIGVESLKNLFNDIQNPNLDSSTHETFTDDSPDYTSVQISSGTTSQSCYVTPENDLSPQNSLKHGNLRSGKRRILLKDEEIQTKSFKFFRNLDPKSSFFTSLQLRRNDYVDNDIEQTTHDSCNYGNKEGYNIEGVETKNYLNRSNHHSKISKNSSTLNKTNSENNFKSAVEQRTVDGINCLNKNPEAVNDLHKSIQHDNRDKVQDNVVQEPKIIMNFSKCQEFEDRLKNKLKENAELDDDCELDYDEYITEEYCPDEEFDEEAGHDEGEIGMDDTIAENTQTTINNIKNTKVSNTASNEDNIKKFKYVIGMISQEIRDVFYAVKNVCEQFFEDSKKPQGPIMKRIELRIKVKNACAHITDLCKSLDSMLECEAKGSDNNIEALFTKAGFQDFYIDDEMKAEYSYTITKCKNYAEVFLRCIQNILQTLNC